MSQDPVFNFKPDRSNAIHVALAEYLEIYPEGVTRGQFIALYSSFIAGMITALLFTGAGIPVEKLSELIRKEGVDVAKKMTEHNASVLGEPGRN